MIPDEIDYTIPTAPLNQEALDAIARYKLEHSPEYRRKAKIMLFILGFSIPIIIIIFVLFIALALHIAGPLGVLFIICLIFGFSLYALFGDKI